MNSIGLAVALLCGSALGLIIAGLYPAGLQAANGIVLLLMALAAFIPAILARTNKRLLWSSLLIAFFLLGCGRALLIHPPVISTDLSYYNSTVSGPTVTVTGVISAEPVFSDRSQRLRIAARSLKQPYQSSPLSIKGDMYAVVPRYPEYATGETVALTGHLSNPPTFTGFDYASYLARQGVFSYMTFPSVVSLGHNEENSWVSFFTAQRIAARETLQAAIAEPEASIAVGVVTGDRSAMREELQTAFRNSGTTHILAISGQNIALLVGLVYLVFAGGRSRRRMPLWLLFAVLILLVVYTIFTGATPSVVRAAIMGAVLLLAPTLGRRYDPMAALAVTATIMVLFDPNLLADAGFQFSFTAILGLAMISPILLSLLQRMRFRRFSFPDLVAYPLAGSFGAVLATLPIVTLFNNQISLVGPFATLTADLALAPLMIFGIATVIAGAVSATAATILGLFVWPFAWWLFANAQFWSSPSWAAIEVNGLSVFHVLAYYAALAGIVIFFSKGRQARLGEVTARLGIFPGTALLAIIAIAIWTTAILLLLS